MSLPYFIEPFDPAWTLPKLALVGPDSGTASFASPRSAYSSDKLLAAPADPTSFKPRKPPARLPNARTVERVACGLVSVAFLFLVLSRETEYITWRGATALLSRTSPGPPKKTNVLRFDRPQPNFRDNLRDDHSYITTFPYAGLTNQLLSTFKLVYMAKRLGRDAILPDLAPNHGEGDYARYSDFFDLDYWSARTDVGLAEWRDVKTADPGSTASTSTRLRNNEHLGCWGEPHASRAGPLERYRTNTSFWPVPDRVRTLFGVEPTTTFDGIETINSRGDGDGENDDVTREWLDEKVAQWFDTVERAPPLPDRHVLCFDNLFYTSSVNLSSHAFVEGQKGDKTIEVEGLERDSQVWLTVGQHLRFTPRVNRIVDDVVRRLLVKGGSGRDDNNNNDNDEQRPFIAMHLRQGDFLDLGRATNESSEIKQKYTTALEELRRRLVEQGLVLARDVDRLSVLLATDSNDDNLLNELSDTGWIVIDHDQLGTRHKYGGWYPALLDSAILSRAVGLVGTKRSTFTYLAERRIETWNKGAAVIVEL